MSPCQAISAQILVFHAAIVDNCERAGRPDRTDAMALRLRNNAAMLVRLQLEMLAVTHSEAMRGDRQAGETRQPEPVAADASAYRGPEFDHPSQAETAETRPQPPVHQPDRVLSGDALSRFVSRRLDVDESPHDVWQQLNHERECAAKPGRTPALPRKGFRSPAG